MTDIVEQAARVACPNGPDHDHQPNLDQGCNWALQLCQTLADAGLLAQPARTAPTRKQIAEALYRCYPLKFYNRKGVEVTLAWDDELPGAIRESLFVRADGVLALMDRQPTVNETKAQALEEAAEIVETHRQQRRETIGPIDENTMDPLLVQAHDSGSTALMDAKSRILARAQVAREIQRLELDRATYNAYARTYSSDYADGYEAATIEARRIAEGSASE